MTFTRALLAVLAPLHPMTFGGPGLRCLCVANGQAYPGWAGRLCGRWQGLRHEWRRVPNIVLMPAVYQANQERHGGHAFWEHHVLRVLLLAT